MTDPLFYSICLILLVTFIVGIRLYRKRRKPIKSRGVTLEDGKKMVVTDRTLAEWMRSHPLYGKEFFEEKT